MGPEIMKLQSLLFMATPTCTHWDVKNKVVDIRVKMDCYTPLLLPLEILMTMQRVALIED